MKQILLTQNKVTFVDDEDYGWLNQSTWYVHKRCGVEAAEKHFGEFARINQYAENR